MLPKCLRPYILQALMAVAVVCLGHLYPNSEVLQAGPVTPFIPMIISALGTGYGIYNSERQNRAQRQQMQQQQGVSRETMDVGRGFLGQSERAFGPALSYYTGLMGNPREATASEQNRIGTLYSGQAQNARNQFPRGGYGVTQAENLRGQQRAANEGVIQQARPMAAGALANMGGGLGQLGMQGFGLGAGIMGNVFNQGMMVRQQGFNEGSAMGQGLFNAYNQYLLNRANTSPSTSNSAGGGMYGSMPGFEEW